MLHRHIQAEKSVLFLETQHCTPCPFTTWSIIFWVVVILGPIFSLLMPNQYLTTDLNTKCGDKTNETCNEFDFINNPTDCLNYHDHPPPTGNNVVLYGSPVLNQHSLGVNFDLRITVKTEDLKKKTEEERVVRFHCRPGETCSNQMLVKVGDVPVSYSVCPVQTPGLESVKDYINDFRITWREDNMSFEATACVMRYCLFGLTLFVYILFIVSSCRVTEKLSAEQKWIHPLMIITLIYTNPLYALVFTGRGGFWHILDHIFLEVGKCFFMLYPLVLLGGFITNKPKILSFYLPRITLIVVYGLLDLSVLIFLAIQQFLDYETELRNIGAFRVVAVSASIFYIIWFFWLGYSVIRVFVVARQHPTAIKGRYQAFIVMVVLAFIVYHAFNLMQQISPSSFEQFYAVGMHWIGVPIACYISILFTPSRMPRTTKTSIKIALHAKRTAPSNEGNQEVEKLSSDQDQSLDFEAGFTGDIDKDRY
ncbi:putative Wnt-binding factor required for Wnt secretion [Blattamonas nauphoetae]|uniref:Wnt-binding factor required for Wnt secretion n=1 Tax=Blattamonas nauphoetae TaxID=2049346 RepID=A0ABQ9YIB6_9EUKA|nr:putative Wnt-binding factor required for Wnt secretion [Blattamonas nauphoetae]